MFIRVFPLNRRASNSTNTCGSNEKGKKNHIRPICYRIKKTDDDTFLSGVSEDDRCFTIAFKYKKTAQQFLRAKLELDAHIYGLPTKHLKKPNCQIEINQMPLDLVINSHRSSNLDIIMFDGKGGYEVFQTEPKTKVESVLLFNYVYHTL